LLDDILFENEKEKESVFNLFPFQFLTDICDNNWTSLYTLFTIPTMSLNTVTKGVGGATGNVNKTLDTAKKGDVSSTVKKTKKQADRTTQDLTGVSVPGEFPDNDDDKNKQAQDMPQVSLPSVSSMFQWLMDKFESTVMGFISRYLPQQRQEAIYKSAMSRPMATTFIICQCICCGVPLLVFMAGVFIFAAVAILLWALLSLLVLGPVLLVTGCSGFLLWGWGWFFYSFVKWVDQRFLGGVLTRFFLPVSSTQDDDSQSSDQGVGSSEQKS
jgi:Promethin